MKLLKALLLTAAFSFTAGCLPEDDEDGSVGSSGESVYEPTYENVFGAAFKTNFNSFFFPYGNASENTIFSTLSSLKKWQTIEERGIDDPLLIPVQINGVRFVSEALDNIERIVGYTLFDRDSLNGVSKEDITYGIVFSAGTALGPQNIQGDPFCGHVGGTDGTVDYPEDWYNDQGFIDVALQVNIDNGTGNCRIEEGIVRHEILHALGMGQHFTGFGEGNRPFDNPLLSTVLNMLYNNTAGTDASEVTIVQSF